MATVSSAKSVVNIAVGVACKSLCKVGLTSLHLLLGVVVGGIFLVDTYWLAFLLRIETQVLKQQHFAWLQSGSCIGSLSTVGGEFNLSAESGGYVVNNLAQGKFRIDFTFGLAHVRHHYERTAVSENLLQSGQRAADAGVVGYLTFFVQGNVEINTYYCLFAGKVVIVKISHVLKDLNYYLFYLNAKIGKNNENAQLIVMQKNDYGGKTFDLTVKRFSFIFSFFYVLEPNT